MSSPSPALSTDPQACHADALSLYQRLLPAPFWDLLCQQQQLRQNNRVYTLAVVVWLMIYQWLQGHVPLDQAVLQLLCGLPHSFWPNPCKRLLACHRKSGCLSANTAAYNTARHQLPLSVVESCCDRIFEQLARETRGALAPLDRPAFLFDGTSVQLPSSDALQQAYPPGSNQHGHSHWPLLRMLVAHDLQTGLALRPHWGPLNGPQAVSEQQLLELALQRLPSASLLVADANFGVFSVAYAGSQRAHPVLLRLTTARALHLAGGPLHDGIDRLLTWKPSREDRRRHPSLPKDACVHGRLLVCLVQPSDQTKPFLLALFTTWEASRQQILAVYGQRWEIETDLRTLKSTLHLEQLRCTTPEMVAKELDLAMAAYNIIRTVIYLAAQKAGLPPRAFSFTRVRNIVQAFAPLLAAAPTPQEAQEITDRLLYYAGQARLPRRTRKRPAYPREVWPKPQSFPHRKE
jgi:putative transposase